MNEKIQRNPQGSGSLGSQGQGASFSFRNAPSPDSSGPTPPPPSDNWVENPEGHLTPSSPPASANSTPSGNPQLLSSSTLKPNYKVGDSDRSETSHEEGEGTEFHLDQNLDLKVDGKIEDLTLMKKGSILPQTAQAFQTQSPSAARLTLATQWTMSNQTPLETPNLETSNHPTMEHWAEVPPPPSPPSEILNQQNPALPGAEPFHDPSPHFQLTGAGYGLAPVEGTFGAETEGFKNSQGFGGYGPGNTLYDLLIGNKQKDDIYAMRRTVRKVDQELKMKMRIVLFLILMGDVQGAVRQLLFEGERMDRVFNRMLVKKLGQVREGKTKILLAFGRKPPPRANPNANKQEQDQDQKTQMRYTQWTTLTTQLTATIQDGERDLMGMIEEARSNISKMWETYQGLKEAEARTSRMLFQSFRE